MAESQREAISLALNSTKLNATNSLFREDPSLVFSVATEARDQTLPGSLLARETLGTRLINTLVQTCLIIISLVQTNVKGNVYLLL